MPILDPQNELFWGVVGIFCPPGESGAKIAPTLGDPPMGRFYHVKIIAEVNSVLPPWAAALIEYLLSLRFAISSNGEVLEIKDLCEKIFVL